jgi:SAM-dependent methyltransferase
MLERWRWELSTRKLLIHGDPMVLDRWRWIKAHLPHEPATIADTGSGNGAISINAGRLGHDVMGMSNSELDVRRANERNPYTTVRFAVQDLRELGERVDLVGQFSVVVCTEVIEHLLDDERLMTALASVLAPGGTLLLTTPNLAYLPLDANDNGPWPPIEDGRHVRKGYDAETLRRLCDRSGLVVQSIEGCSGDRSQRLTTIYRAASRRWGTQVATLAVTPLRLWPTLGETHRRPTYSVCLVARKPIAS